MHLLCQKLLGLIILQFLAPPLTSAQLEAQFLTTTLPQAVAHSTPFYDGDDTIYLFGGTHSSGTHTNEILKFTISTSTIEPITPFPAVGSMGCIAQFVNGSIYYFGGGTGHGFDGVFSFDPITEESSMAGEIPHSTNPLYCTSAQYVGDFGDDYKYAYIFGGLTFNNAIHRYDMEVSDWPGSIVVGNLPLPVPFVSSITIDNKVYIFVAPLNGSIMVLDLVTMDTEIQPVVNLPGWIGMPKAVRVNKYAYIVGAMDQDGDTGALIQFNTETFEFISLPVENLLPEGATHFYSAPMVVYVEGLDRIYGFGGMSSNSGNVTYHNDIWFIDLNPVVVEPTFEVPTTTGTPDMFDCHRRPNGLYPYPDVCRLYIRCENGTSGVYGCPPPLLFDAAAQECKSPETVDCDLNCIDKPDGDYPHPHDCSLFIFCYGGDIRVYACPFPLLYDPVRGECNIPELVDCDA